MMRRKLMLKTNRRTELALGTVQLGMPYGIANNTGKPDIVKAIEILRFAMENGVTTLDTAPGYGDSEETIGKYLYTYPEANRPSIVTKLPSPNICLSSFADVYTWVERTINESANKLGMPILDAVLLHDPRNLQSHYGHIVSSLIKCKSIGFIKKIGVSVYSPEEAMIAIKLGTFDILQIPINIFDHRWIQNGILRDIHLAGIEVHARSVFLQGLFFLDHNELPEFLLDAKEPLRNLKRLSIRTGLSIRDLALLYIRDVPGVDKIIIGAETVDQLRENVEAFQKRSLPTHVIQEIGKVFEKIPEAIINPSRWGKRGSK
jgi:aryl-alcohol dehydrogenase-like predicted oxidoreductase